MTSTFQFVSGKNASEDSGNILNFSKRTSGPVYRTLRFNPSTSTTSKIWPGFLVDSLTRHSSVEPIIQIPDSDTTRKLTLDWLSLDMVIIEPDTTLGFTDCSSIILFWVEIEIRLSEIRLTFSITVLTLGINLPWTLSNFSSEEEGFPGIETLGLPVDGCYQLGLITGADKLSKWFMEIAENAQSNIKLAKYEILENETEVKVMGQSIYEDYSRNS